MRKSINVLLLVIFWMMEIMTPVSYAITWDKLFESSWASVNIWEVDTEDLTEEVDTEDLTEEVDIEDLTEEVDTEEPTEELMAQLFMVSSAIFLESWNNYIIEYELYDWINNEHNPISYNPESGDIVLLDPIKTWYKFGWWFLEETFLNQITKIDNSFTWDVCLYAKWTKNIDVVYKTPEETNIVYTDTAWNEFGIWTITISDWWKSITMFDRNLWAVRTWVDSVRWYSDAYWYFFQRWNSFWFPRGRVSYSWQSSQIDASSYSWNNQYISGVFIERTNWTSWDSSLNNDLWWGWLDNPSGTSENTVNEWYKRQWPCPNWYHVPAIWEWEDLVNLYWNVNSWWIERVWQKINDVGKIQDFINIFYIPMAWYGCFDHARYLCDSSSWIWIWSSSPSWKNNAKNIVISPSNINPHDWSSRAMWYYIRCFADKFSVDFYDWEDLVLYKEVELWNTVEEPNITNKEWYTFWWWYTDKECSEWNEYDFRTEVDKHTILYAKWIWNVYNIKYVLDWWNNNDMNPKTFNLKSLDIELLNPKKDGYIFKWWFLENTFINQVIRIDASLTWDIIIYAKWEEVQKVPAYSWWGSRSSLAKKSKDSKNKTDNSEIHNSADEKSVKPEVKIEVENKWDADITEETTIWDTSEMVRAYKFAYEHGIIAKETFEESDTEELLNRKELAKILSLFAINVMWMEPEEWKAWCESFNDISNQTAEMKWYMKTACELRLMWLESDWITVANHFDPNKSVTRAEFWTTLSRLLYGWVNNLHDDLDRMNNEWYEKHLRALKDNKIMTQIEWEWVKKIEIRWYVMLMLMRSANN